jgi:hypothetical protein
MAIQQNFPDEGPTLNLNFAGSRTLDPRITFTRTSSATVMGREGLIEVVPANTPRFDHLYNLTTGEVESLGLLIEESRSNLVSWSEDFSNSRWTRAGFTTSFNTTETIAPDGSYNSDKILETTDNNIHINNTFNAIGISSNTVYTFSIFVKPINKQFVQLVFDDNATTNGSYANFNLSTVGVTTSLNYGSGSGINAGISSFPNGWYRLSVTGTAGTTSTLARLSVNSITSGTSGVFPGFVGNTSNGYYIWGAQLEQGSFPTSYVSTTNSTATRTADNASMAGSNFSSWYNQTEGTIISNYSTYKPTNAGNSTDFAIMSPEVPPLDRIVGWQNINQIPLFSVIQNNTTNFLVGKNETYINRLVKKALAIKTNNMIISVDGDLYTADFASGVPDVLPTTFNRIVFGLEGVFASYLNGHIRQFIYYPTRLPNSQLVSLTK